MINFKKCTCFIMLLFLIITMISLNSSAETVDEFVWKLIETIEFDKVNEIENFNSINDDLYDLSVTTIDRKYSFQLNYLGKDNNQGTQGRYFKAGDSASSSVSFGSIPSVINHGDVVEITLEIGITNDTTYDKSYEFMETKARAFFDKFGAQPDIPSSDAVYFKEKSGEEKGTSIGTKTGTSSSVATKLYATAARGSSEGQQMIICLCAEGKIAVGTKYVYEWLPLNSQDNNPNKNDTIREAYLNNIHGDVLVNTESGLAYKTANNGMSIAKGNIIKSGQDSNCVLKFDDESFINLSNNSIISVLDNSKDNTKIKFISGDVWAYIKGSDGDNKLKIEMEFAALSIDGAIFALEENNGCSIVWLFSQVASFTSSQTGEIAQLKSGQKASFDKNGILTIENFNIKENAENWKIPLSTIVEDSGFGWVNLFIYGLCGILLMTFIIIFVSVNNKKRRKAKRITKFIPDNGRCVFCGKNIDSDDVFCPNCGAAVKKQKNDSIVDEK